jgi:peptidoglycan-associated lipoprotein
MRFSLVAALLPFAIALACGSDPKPPPAAPGGATVAPSAAAASEEKMPDKPGDDPSQSQINISEEIRRACGISESDAFFAFDSAKVRDQDQRVLKQLADCFTSGALKGREMRLVGHADPRGEAEYNMQLGDRRAQNVKTYIVKAGLDAAKINVTSRGAMDATGTDEATWSKDRRVDVMLAE